MNIITETKKVIYTKVAQSIELEYMKYLEKVNGKTYLVIPEWRSHAEFFSDGEIMGWNWQDMPVKLKKKGAEPKRLEFLANGITTLEFIDGDEPTELLLLDYIKMVRKAYNLITTVKDGDLLTVQTLLATGVNLYIGDEDGETALHWASKEGHIKIVQALIEARANMNVTKNRGETALMLASVNGQTETVQALLEAKADVDVEDIFGYTALIKASRKGHTKTVQALLDAGADVNVKSNNGYTALSLALGEERTETVKLLKDAGAEE